jgi:preprotein translocase subunit SecD
MRKNFLKILVILVVVGWSALSLMPTYQLAQNQKEADRYYQSIEENTKLARNEIKAALSTNSLELQVRDAFSASNGNTVEDLVADVNELVRLEERIDGFRSNAIKLGLDLQGGAYLVYEVDLPQLLYELAKQNNDILQNAIARARQRSIDENEDFFESFRFVFQQDSISLSRFFGSARQSDDEIIDHLRTEAEDAVDRTIEVIRNRIDQFGVSEPSITKQGDLRIVIELAGINDVNRAKGLIRSTALLEFQLEREPEIVIGVMDKINRVLKHRLSKGEVVEESVDSTATPEKRREDKEVSVTSVFGEGIELEGEEGDSTVLVDEEILEERPFDALLANVGGNIAVPAKNVRAVERIINSPEVQAIMPDDAEFLVFAQPERYGEQDYYFMTLVRKKPELLGSAIEDAQAQIGGGDMMVGQSVVNLKLNSEGGRVFSRVTAANVQKKLAIVLDGKIVSNPVINERIPHGNAQISGMANIEEARDLAIKLRAGALPVPIEVIEERTVGPSLGQDSVNSGAYSALVGLVLVVAFMLVYYKFSGIVANVALLLNLVIIMAVLAAFHATLTLPGVAGIILTIGMAVDANVLIFERIREELRGGKTVRAAIDSGYARAFKTILDANVTTFLTALVLYQFGTGPIRGFAVTLSIGIVASMFTAILVTRVIFDYFTSSRTISKLSI